MKKVNVKKIKDLQSFVAIHRQVKGSRKDYQTVYLDFCKGEYEETKQTRLYTKHGGEYCTLLEVLNHHYSDHQEVVDA